MRYWVNLLKLKMRKGIVMRFFLVLFLSYFSLGSIIAQDTLKGKVMDEKGVPLLGVLVVHQASQKATSSTDDGSFQLVVPSIGDGILRLKLIGYIEKEQIVSKQNSISVTLTANSKEIGAVEVSANAIIFEKLNSPVTITRLEAKEIQNRSSDAKDLLTRSSGVKVRQRGGLGSFANISVNGLSGKQIKYFVDGIPQEDVGLSLNVLNIPIGLIEAIEIYKGLVPVYLGSDALGGAVNIITNKDPFNYADVSVSRSSFNTTIATVNARYYLPKSPIYIGMNASHQYSDNSYKMDVEVADSIGRPDTIEVKRFHDAYANNSLQLDIGLKPSKFVDDFRISGQLTQLQKEFQHNFTNVSLFIRPYGQVQFQEQVQNVQMHYQKKDILKKLDVNLYSAYYYTQSTFIDTANNRYDWYGNISDVRSSTNKFGELEFGTKHFLEINTQNLINRVNLIYKVSPTLSVSGNIVHTQVFQEGRDTLATRLKGSAVDIYTFPQKIWKDVAGLMVEHSLFDKKFAQMAGIKYYRIDANATSNSFLLNVESIKQKSYVKNNRGYFYGLKYAFFKNKFIAKANYEYATRLPDQYELLGDRVFILSNPILVPELSNNYNIGFLSQVNTKLGRVEVEYNRFIRNTQNNIYLVPSKAGAQYQNLANVKSIGHEATLNYMPIKVVRLSLTATYQDIRNVSDTTSQFSTIDKRYYNKTLPNIPLKFGSSELLVLIPKVFIAKDRLEFFYNNQYTDAFYLSFAEEGLKSTKNAIPEQFIQNAGITYSLPFNKASLGFEVHNLADTKAYDNFYIRKPGRSFHVKLRYFINKSV